jgi:hypothetical protein
MRFFKSFISGLFKKEKSLLPSNLGSNKSFEEKYNELGIFEYYENGFRIVSGNLDKTLNWNDITELEVYKSDLFTIDRIDMDIIYGEKYITVTEDQPGWYQFLLKLKEAFPSIPENWEGKIIQPPFVSNRQIIYRKTEICGTN